MIKDIKKARIITVSLIFGLAILFVIFLLSVQPHQGMTARALDSPRSPFSKSSTAIHATNSLTIETTEQTALNIEEWSQLAYDPQRTGYVPTEVPGPWRVKWIWNGPAGGGDAGPADDHLRLHKDVQPIAGDGKLYVGHRDGIVRAISEAAGAVAWSSEIGGEIRNTGAFDPETSSVYFGSTNGQVYRLSAATGQQQAAFSLGGRVMMAPLLVSDTIYIGSTNGAFYALDKITLSQRWVYQAGAALWASPAYSANYGGLVIIQVEPPNPETAENSGPKYIDAIQTSNGARRWRVEVNADIDPNRPSPPYEPDPDRELTSFADTYPVVSDANDVVIIRSYLDWDKMHVPSGGAPTTLAEIRNHLIQDPTLQSFFVLELNDGSQRFVAPVMGGAIGNGGDFESIPPQAVVKRLVDGTEVAYLFWRNKQSCSFPNACDSRDDTTIGEMDLETGNIRFVQDYKHQGSMRLHTDEQSSLAMAGNTLFQAHWMTLGAVQIVDRSTGLGNSYSNPIRTIELTPTVNTLAVGACPDREPELHFCPQSISVPGDGYLNDPGFYIYYSDQPIYDEYWTTPVRSAIISNGTIYWKSVDGVIIALQTTSSSTSNSLAKTASFLLPEFGETVTYTIIINHNDGSFINPIRVTDTIPAGLNYIPSSLTATTGEADDSAAPILRWSGIVPTASTLTIRYATTITETKPALLQNIAVIDTGPDTGVFTRSAMIVANGYGVYLPIILKLKETF